MALVAQLPKNIPITMGGDLIDRGRDSKKVVDWVIDNNIDCVRGNHEAMMLSDLQVFDDVENPIRIDYYHSVWLPNGGQVALESYRKWVYIENDGKYSEIDTAEKRIDADNHFLTYDTEALKKHMSWMSNLPFYLEYPDLKNDKGQYLLVSHSTAAEAWHMKDAPEGTYGYEQFTNRIMWDRKPHPAKIPGVFNIYGHTPQKHGPTIGEHFACVDTGAYFKRKLKTEFVYPNEKSKPPYGKMTALQWPEMKIYTQENIEEAP